MSYNRTTSLHMNMIFCCVLFTLQKVNGS